MVSICLTCRDLGCPLPLWSYPCPPHVRPSEWPLLGPQIRLSVHFVQVQVSLLGGQAASMQEGFTQSLAHPVQGSVVSRLSLGREGVWRVRGLASRPPPLRGSGSPVKREPHLPAAGFLPPSKLISRLLSLETLAKPGWGSATVNDLGPRLPSLWGRPGGAVQRAAGSSALQPRSAASLRLAP